ncbi:MAG: hypothetical protein KAV44_07835 [Bacteroidales bacterium]|nr:hypothetical protein [Bacteroidales bacterium]
MEQQELNIEKSNIKAYNDGDKSHEVFITILISFFLTCGTYAFFDQVLNFQIQLINFLSLIFSFFSLFCLSIIFVKAGESGWKVFIPFYNIIILLKIVEKPAWWTFLFLIPIVNVVFLIWVVNLLSLRFGKDEGFTFGLIILPFIFYPILAYGDAKYNKN